METTPLSKKQAHTKYSTRGDLTKKQKVILDLPGGLFSSNTKKKKVDSLNQLQLREY
jgi:hypothetical protein